MGSKNKNKTNKNKVEAVSTGDGAEHSGGSHQNNGKGKKGKIITDARFASLHSDPRFTEAPKNKEKVSIDSRFNRMFTDKNFASSKARIDKRGKPKKKETAVESLKRYYRLEDDEEEERAKKVERIQKMFEEEESGSGIAKLEGEDDGSESNQSEESDSGGENEEDKRKKRNLKVESESEESGSEDVESDDDASASTTDSDEGDDELYEEDEGALMQEENIPEIDKETHRLAVVNMDWSEVKAVDLYVLLSSFLPKEGHIKSVSVYPSEFGIKRMEEEAIHGPVGLFDEDKEKNDEDDDDDDDDDDDIDNEKLRTYEISRLRYYYAVVECDSIATADYLYKTCDGVEFERSSTKLDLRFIPDSMEFKHQPRDVATEAPADYEGVDFHTKALQHSKIQLTWDDDEPQRAKTLKRKFNADQLADLELEEFLASDEGESSDSADAEAIRERSAKKQKKQDLYRSLLQSGDGSDENDQDEEENQDMEVTFNTGLEDLSKRILEKKDRNSESVWEAYLRKRREKRKNRKNRSKNSSEDESSDTDEAPIDEPDDFFVEESSAKGSKKSRGKTTRNENQDDEMAQETEASRAELELLLADDKETDTNLKGYNLKRKKLKGKKGKEAPDEEKLPAADYDDPRFAPLFSSPLFALDPTDPQFKRSAAYARQMAQKQQKVERGNVGAKEQSAPIADEAKRVDEGGSQPDGLTSKKEKHELSSLVKSIKMKSKQVPQQSKNPKGSKRK